MYFIGMVSGMNTEKFQPKKLSNPSKKVVMAQTYTKIAAGNCMFRFRVTVICGEEGSDDE